MADLDKMIEEIEKMTVLELNDLVKKIEEKFGRIGGGYGCCGSRGRRRGCSRS